MKRIPTNLQPDSVKVFFLHIRYEDVSNPLQFDIKGGVTVAFRYLSELDQWEVAVSKCNILDNFCKRIGRTIASNRLNWGNCHRIHLDTETIKDTVEAVRKYVMEKYELEWADPQTNQDSSVSEVIH